MIPQGSIATFVFIANEAASWRLIGCQLAALKLSVGSLSVASWQLH